MSEALPFPQDRTCPYHPPAAYQEAARERPLAKVRLYDGREVWWVTGHALARTLLAHPGVSSDRHHPAFPIPVARFESLRTVRSLLTGTDDPEHGIHRRLLIPAFTYRRANRMGPGIQAIVDKVLDRFVEQGPPVDLVSEWAEPVAAQVVFSLLDIPAADHALLVAQVRRLMRGPTQADSLEARHRLLAALDSAAAERQHGPAGPDTEESVLDILAGHTRSGALSTEDRAGLLLTLVAAGYDTMANMLALSVYTLLQHPDQLGLLRDDAALAPAAIEELLRFLSVADGLLRVATQDIDVVGHRIRAGDGLVLSASVLNRDPAVYHDPDRLSWDRPAGHHLAFGFGPHQCLGQSLARTELTIALRTLVTRLPTLALAVPPTEVGVNSGETTQGIHHMPVTWQ